MKSFKFATLQMGSGWMSGHVVLNEYVRWPDKGGDNIYLNYDTDCFEEFSGEIDRLIAELEAVRKMAKQRFAKEKKRELAEIAHLKAQRAASV